MPGARSPACSATCHTSTRCGPTAAGANRRAGRSSLARDGRHATRGDYAYLYLCIPAGTGRLTATTSGGTGDADLYYSSTGWATTGSYTAKATGSGNAHTLTVDHPAAGAHCISLYGVRDFGQVSIATSY
ncbi:PPC domain-containing protein [Streptomyces sp. DT224]|uniref:PPC domain-containing protein n=1 Tax=Streptomyces sp. DT224 TaxID=3393426 RepID=UPI003CF87C18